MMNNPFKYGVVVTGDDFVDRKEEIEILYKELSSGKSVILYSERRLGKTSLLIEFNTQKAMRMIPVYIDLYGMTTKEDLARQIVNNVISASYSNLDKIRNAVRNYFVNLKPKMIISADGKITLDLSAKKTYNEDELAEILDFPEKVAKEKKKRIILVFDEFQEISLIDGLKMEKLMRSRFQHHKNVSYVFIGSKEHLLRQMFEEKTRAFFKFARPLSLGPIPKKEFTPFIIQKFKQTGKKVTNETIEDVLNFTHGHPYFTQYLCHEIWYMNQSIKDEDIIKGAITNIIAQQSIAFEHIWDELKSRNQRGLLIGIAHEGAHNYSPDFIQEYNLKSQSHVEKSLQMLKNKGVLNDKGQIIDIFFKEWIIDKTRR
jgi:AAA+ ATPase superfamily predicted ATPase